MAPLGIRRGELGSQAAHLEVRQFYGAVQAAKALPQRVKIPPAPKAPEPASGIAAGAADTLGSVLGHETAHQRAMKVHAETMKQWRQTVKDLRQQDAEEWEQLKAYAVMAPFRQRRQALAVPTSIFGPTAVALTGPSRHKPR